MSGRTRQGTGEVAKQTFRPEIQALRAVAVLAVVVFHLRATALPGGYVGVDVFFVISGFLITSHLVGELRETGRIRFARFYARRIRRLLPAALTVLAACLVATALWIPATEIRQNLSEITASALYAENWVLAANSVDYLSTATAHSLAQHYWSLSVEEQFYLVWPLLLLVAWAIGTRLSRLPRRALPALLLGLLFVVSLWTSVAWTAADPAPAYFVTPTRAWEFAAGGLLALVPAAWMTAPGRTPARARAAAAWIGVLLIAWVSVAYSAATPFPGSAAVVPVAGALLVIAAGSSGSRASLDGVFRLWPVQRLGALSYGIYLWHWPLVVLYPLIAGRPISLGAAALLLAASIVLAELTMRFIERPIQRGAFWTGRRWPSFAFAAVAMAIVVAAAGVQAASVRTTSPLVVSRYLAAGGSCVGAAAMDPSHRCADIHRVTATVAPELAPAARGDRTGCNQVRHVAAVLSCVRGDPATARATIALFGDSHASLWLWPLERVAASQGWAIRTYLKATCPGVVQLRAHVAADCNAWTRAAIAQIARDPTITTIVYSISAHLYRTGGTQSAPSLRAADVRATLDRLLATGKPVVVIRDVPGTAGVDAPTCLETDRSPDDPCWTSRSAVLSRDVLLTAAESEGARVSVVDLSDFFCDATRCHSVIGGLSVYGDSAGHVTVGYLRTLAPYLGRALVPLVTVPGSG
ncbi:SGNH hydrolase domain-containing protein [Galbitalea soli]|uniref:Acyltransferase n=1 Tax=Galbitalea soli TaxID=1268042 RepID=A0A7C9PNM2_9MICO|nr:acyltransferase [Galbitalea soli]NYJ30300.1 peptidoglycan/LPS O-acetylase OafA/YrhL [Galbitalea soli]